MAIKRLTLLLSICILYSVQEAFSQGGNPNSSNSFEVTRIISPTPYKNYRLNDSSDFVIRIRNLGPNDIIAGDLFSINYSIYGNDGNNNQLFDTNIYVGRPMPVGISIDYVLRKNILLSTADNSFVACSDVSGTGLYPVNTNKFPSKCSPFLVSLEKLELKLNEVYYAEGRVYFKLNSKTPIHIEIYDLTGKKLKESKLTNSANQSLAFNAPAKGFYFVKAFNDSGATTTVKFIVNQ